MPRARTALIALLAALLPRGASCQGEPEGAAPPWDRLVAIVQSIDAGEGDPYALAAELPALLDALEPGVRERLADVDSALVRLLVVGLTRAGTYASGEHARDQRWIEALFARAESLAPHCDRIDAVGEVVHSLGKAQMDLGDLDAACATFERLQEGKADHPHLAAHGLALKADAERMSGDCDRALRTLERLALDYDALEEPARKSARAYGVDCELHGVRAQVYLFLGLADLAERDLSIEQELAARHEAEFDQPDYRLAAACRRVDYSLQIERYGEALKDAEGVLADARLEPEVRGLLTIQAAIARAFLARMGRFEFEGAVRAMDATLTERLHPLIRLVVQLHLVKLLLASGDTVRGDALLARVASDVEELDATGDVDVPALVRVTLRAIQGRRARETHVEARAALAQLETATNAFMQDWSRSPLRAGGLNFLQAHRHRVPFTELVDLSVAVLGETAGLERALGFWLRAQCLGTLARRQELEPPTLEEMRERLMRDGAGILCLMPTLEGTLAIAVDASGMVHGWGKPIHELERATSSLNALLARVSTWTAEERERAERIAIRLAELMSDARVRARMRSWKHVRLVGADTLPGIPLHVLPWSDALERWGEVPASYLPSIPVGCWLARRREASQERVGIDWVLVAAPEHDVVATAKLVGGKHGESAARTSSPKPLLRIPFDEDDRSHALGGSEVGVRALIGGDATWRALLALPHASVWNLVCHGAQIDDWERSAALVLTPDDDSKTGLVTCDDVESVRTPPLVVLAACEVLCGRMRSGEGGLEHLGGAFLVAGTDTVIAPTDFVGLRRSIALCGALRRRLYSGMRVTDAWQAARHEQDAHPLDLAAWRIMGLGDVSLPAGMSPWVPTEASSPVPAAGWPYETFVVVVCLVALLLIIVLCLRGRPKTAAR